MKPPTQNPTQVRIPKSTNQKLPNVSERMQTHFNASICIRRVVHDTHHGKLVAPLVVPPGMVNEMKTRWEKAKEEEREKEKEQEVVVKKKYSNKMKKKREKKREKEKEKDQEEQRRQMELLEEEQRRRMELLEQRRQEELLEQRRQRELREEETQERRLPALPAWLVAHQEEEKEREKQKERDKERDEEMQDAMRPLASAAEEVGDWEAEEVDEEVTSLRDLEVVQRWSHLVDLHSEFSDDDATPRRPHAEAGEKTHALEDNHTIFELIWKDKGSADGAKFLHPKLKRLRIRSPRLFKITTISPMTQKRNLTDSAIESAI